MLVVSLQAELVERETWKSTKKLSPKPRLTKLKGMRKIYFEPGEGWDL